MDTKFKSQICTTREQSERLLQLGLKKETADMCYTLLGGHDESLRMLVAKPCFYHNDIPAWSLHRLVYLCRTDNIRIAFNEKDCWGGNIKRISLRKSFEKDNLYDNLCDCIEWLIKEGYFNKEYLV